MPDIDLILDGDGAWQDLDPEKVIHLTGSFKVAALAKGMASGKPSLMIRIDLPDGRVVLQETSMRLWIAVARALAARFDYAVND